MDKITTEMVCDWYYKMIMADGRKSWLLLKILKAIVDGGQKLHDLEQMMDGVDGGAVLRVAEFQMRMKGDAPGDSLTQAIARILS